MPSPPAVHSGSPADREKVQNTAVDFDVILVNTLGFTATSFSIVMWFPQARTTWLNRNDPVRLAGISEPTQWLLVGCYLLWGVYGLISNSVWVAMPSVVALPLAVATIVVVRRGRRHMPLVRSVPIIGIDDSVGVPLFTSPVSIVTSGESLAVGSTLVADANPTTGTMPILH